MDRTKTNSTPASSNQFAGMVRVYHFDTKGTKSFVGLYNERRLSIISTTARQMLGTQSATPKVMNVNGVDLEQLEYVVTAAIHYGAKLHLKVNDKSMVDIIYILDVLETLGIMPRQIQVEGQLVHLLAHEPITPWAMANVHEIFGKHGNNSKVWRVMVHQVAWNIAHGHLNEQEVEALNEAGKYYPELDRAMREKIAHLKGCIEHGEAKKAKVEAKARKRESDNGRHARKHTRGASKTSSNDTKKPTLSHREKAEQKRNEEDLGLRATSESTVDFLKHRRPTGFWVTPKMSQKDRKMAQRMQAEKADEETGANQQDSNLDGEVGGVDVAL